jgi:hypothetical protein
VTEQLADLEAVEHTVVEYELDCSAAYDAQVLDGLCALREDDRAGKVKLHVDRTDDAREFGTIDAVEWDTGCEEVDDLS